MKKRNPFFEKIKRGIVIVGLGLIVAGTLSSNLLLFGWGVIVAFGTIGLDSWKWK